MPTANLGWPPCSEHDDPERRINQTESAHGAYDHLAVRGRKETVRETLVVRVEHANRCSRTAESSRRDIPVVNLKAEVDQILALQLVDDAESARRIPDGVSASLGV